jgi:hypothetical protein
MSARLILSRFVPFVALSGALAIATIAGDWLLHRLGFGWVGRYLGIPGTLLIAASLTYSLRKRKKIGWGKPPKLLAFHEFGGWFGSLLVLLHSGMHFNALLPWLATIAMGANVLSGLVGKVLLKSSRELVRDRRLALTAQGLKAEDIEAELLWDSAAVRAMNQWRTVHIPIFVLFVTLALGHIVSIFLFWAWR